MFLAHGPLAGHPGVHIDLLLDHIRTVEMVVEVEHLMRDITRIMQVEVGEIVKHRKNAVVKMITGFTCSAKSSAL